MYHLTTLTDERIRDLRATADELRSARSDHDHRGWLASIRLRTGTVFLADRGGAGERRPTCPSESHRPLRCAPPAAAPPWPAGYHPRHDDH